MRCIKMRIARLGVGCVVLFWLLVTSSGVLAAGTPAKLLPIQSWRTANGVRVFFIAAHDLPMLDVRFLVNAGSARDGDSHGLAMLTNSLLLEGSRQHPAVQIKQQADQLGTQFSALVGRQMAQIDMRCLTTKSHLSPSITSLQQQISQPAFAPAAIGRIKTRMSAALLDYQQDPSDVALNTMMGQLYPHKPYAHQPLGNADSIKLIIRDEVLDFYKKYYVTGNMKLLMVGDLSNKAAHSIATKLTRGIEAGKAAAPLSVAPNNKQSIEKVSFAAEQSHILFGQLGVMYQDPGFLPLQVANYTLGGSGLVSRLFNQVRKRYGLAYSINSYLVPTLYRGPWVVSFQTAHANAKQAMDLVRTTLQNYLQHGPTAAEVSMAKQALRGQQLINLVSHRSMLQALSIIATYNLPLDYYTQRLRRLAQVTPAQVRGALHKMMSPQRWVEVSVGAD